MKKSIKIIQDKLGEAIRSKKPLELDSLSRRLHASPILVVKIMKDYERKGLVMQI